ncbi:MAG: hypothetical protein FWE34_08775 [Defluviitaleaceae bacterium]|nr:hypothetical protein [Defluviitaleaceae bacterium]
MMSKNDKISFAKRNMAGLLGLPHDIFDQEQNVFVANDSMKFWITTFGANAVVVGKVSIIDYCKNQFKNLPPEEIIDSQNLFQLDIRLRDIGYQLHSLDTRYMHLYPEVSVPKPQGFRYELLKGGEVNNFYQNYPLDTIFKGHFSNDCVKPLAFAAFDGEKLVSLAYAENDRDLWSISRIDTLRGYGGLGLGRYLVKELALHLEKYNKVVYYTTWPSNLPSVRLALGAGFVPVWMGTYAVKENLRNAEI